MLYVDVGNLSLEEIQKAVDKFSNIEPNKTSEIYNNGKPLKLSHVKEDLKEKFYVDGNEVSKSEYEKSLKSFKSLIFECSKDLNIEKDLKDLKNQIYKMFK